VTNEIEIVLEKVEDIAKIMSYGIMSTLGTLWMVKSFMPVTLLIKKQYYLG